MHIQERVNFFWFESFEYLLMTDISYIICATPRCGSSLLCETLRSTGLAGNPEEYLLPLYDAITGSSAQDKPVAPSTGSDAESFIKPLILKYRAPNGVFGVKVMQNHFRVILDYLGQRDKDLSDTDILNRFFHNLHWIRIIRRDRIRQAVSMAKSVQTDVWFDAEPWVFDVNPDQIEDDLERAYMKWVIDARKKPMASSDKLQYDYGRIKYFYNTIEEQEQGWDAFFRRMNIKPYLVEYESLTEHYETTALEILNYLQIPGADHAVFKKRILKKQSDAVNEEWIRRFRIESDVSEDTCWN